MKERYRSGRRGSAMGIALALLVEALLILVILTLGSSIPQDQADDAGRTLVRFRAASAQEEAAKPPAAEPRREAERVPRERVAPAQQRPPRPDVVRPPAEPPRETPPVPLIPLSRSEIAAADISALPAPPAPARPARAMMGPADTGAPADTPRVSGSGPGGEPLYAASWYREPSDDELRGYLSTATGPGWGLIACRTARDFRVEDCVGIDEYPAGSNIVRAVLAAAWQFRVRPPRIGGRPRIGEWVRIRIDYDIRRR
jgi:protein TonB